MIEKSSLLGPPPSNPNSPKNSTYEEIIYKCINSFALQCYLNDVGNAKVWTCQCTHGIMKDIASPYCNCCHLIRIKQG